MLLWINETARKHELLHYSAVVWRNGTRSRVLGDDVFLSRLQIGEGVMEYKKVRMQTDILYCSSPMES